MSIPVVASNRINMPRGRRGDAGPRRRRPGLDGPAVPGRSGLGASRRRTDRADEINTCIACNQACLDHVFAQATATCLVNPRAGRETELALLPDPCARRASRSSAPDRPGWPRRSTAAERGHAVELFEADDEIGGQFGIARRIPGKEEFAETIRYYQRRLELTGVKLHLGRRVDRRRAWRGFDEVVARDRRRPARSRPSPASTTRRCSRTPTSSADGKPVGKRVAVIGAGGIGVDVSEFLTTTSVPDPRPGGVEGGVGCHRSDAPRPARSTKPRPEPSPRAGVPAAAQDRRRSAPASARPPAGCTAPR